MEEAMNEHFKTLPFYAPSIAAHHRAGTLVKPRGGALDAMPGAAPRDLAEALRRKFGTPQAAMQALGLDAALLTGDRKMPSWISKKSYDQAFERSANEGARPDQIVNPAGGFPGSGAPGEAVDQEEEDMDEPNGRANGNGDDEQQALKCFTKVRAMRSALSPGAQEHFDNFVRLTHDGMADGNGDQLSTAPSSGGLSAGGNFGSMGDRRRARDQRAPMGGTAAQRPRTFAQDRRSPFVHGSFLDRFPMARHISVRG
jgi:hypothetical protein